MTSYEDHHVEQALSLLNDQQECVTLRSIMLELTVTRCVARDILEEVVNRSAASSMATNYEVMRMIPKKAEDGKRILMELVATDPSASDDENNNKGSIFSISICNDTQDAEMDEEDVDENGNVIPNPTSSQSNAAVIQLVSAAHEKALAVQRDMFTSGSNGGVAQLCSIFGADCIGTSSGSRYVLPAPELCVENEDGIRFIRREKRGRDVVVVGASYPSSAAGKKSKFGTTSSVVASKTSTHASTKKGKATTAAAFFKNANAASSKAKKPAAKKKEEEKENSRNKKVTTSVDDFVGDIDEDEEFLEEERARKERVAKEAMKDARERVNDDKVKERNTEGRAKDALKRKKHIKESDDNAMEIDYDDVQIDDSEKKSGALDAFTKKREKSAPSTAASSGSGGVKKRRKKLVEETTVDANGYMRTETITVWEDVSDDDMEVKSKPAVAKAVATKPKAKVKKSGGSKKQAGLASFFAKKK